MKRIFLLRLIHAEITAEEPPKKLITDAASEEWNGFQREEGRRIHLNSILN